MDDWERHVTPLLQDMGCSNDETQDDFFNQQEVSGNYVKIKSSAIVPDLH